MNYYAKLLEEKQNAKTINFLGKNYVFGEDKIKNRETWQRLIHEGSIARSKAQEEYKVATQQASEKYRKIEADIDRQIDNIYSSIKGLLNSKDEKTNEDAPFTKKRECLATLDRMIYYVQRKKSQVQQWKYIDEDFDENEFLSDLKDVLRAIEGIMG